MASQRGKGDAVRIMVTGSRSWTDTSTIRMALAAYADQDVTLVEGGAWGADRIARNTAGIYGYKVETHLADWDRYGKRAGILRNVEMVESGIDEVIAFQVGTSRGTTHAIEAAKKRGIPVKIWRVPQGDYTQMTYDRVA